MVDTLPFLRVLVQGVKHDWKSFLGPSVARLYPSWPIVTPCGSVGHGQLWFSLGCLRPRWGSQILYGLTACRNRFKHSHAPLFGANGSGGIHMSENSVAVFNGDFGRRLLKVGE